MGKKFIKTRMKIEDIQANLDTLPTIKFKDCSYSNIDDILKKILNNNYTIDNSTYYSKNNRKQCNQFSSRGIADIYRLCKYYFPETTLKEVVDSLQKRTLNYGYCFTTNQDVFKDSYKDNMWKVGNIEADKKDPSIRLKNRKRVYIES